MGEQEHIVAKCGSHTGHVLNAVAFCDSRETAEVLVDALALLKEFHDHGYLTGGDHDKAKAILERAGLV